MGEGERNKYKRDITIFSGVNGGATGVPSLLNIRKMSLISKSVVSGASKNIKEKKKNRNKYVVKTRGL